MAKKLLNPLEDPPTASSSDEDEVETSSGEDEEQISESSSEEDEPKNPAKLPSTKTLKNPSAAPANPDSGSKKDSVSKPEPAEKPIAVTTAKSGEKRPSEATTSEDMHAKRTRNDRKKVSGDVEKKSREDNKKPAFQRRWSEEDEVSLLQGMIDFKAETGTSPYDDLNGFYDVAKKYVSFDVSKIQFGDKIRSLKRKYMVNDKKKGKEPSFSKPHDKKCLGLAKYIWGSDGMALDSALKSPVKSKKIEKKKKLDSEVEEEDKEMLGSDGMDLESAAVKSNGKVKKGESLKPEGDKVEEGKDVGILGGDLESPSWFEKSFLVRSIASLGVDEYSVKQKWSKVPVETKNRIEENLKLVEAKEYELLLKKGDILKEVISVISEAI